ncbi:MAG: Gp37-like protein [Massilimicrobiota timonensis]
MEIGCYLSSSRNDFELTVPYSVWNPKFNEGSIIYDNDETSEYGGRIQGITSDTANESVILYGYTWRGLISKKYAVPPSGQSHYQARGDANDFLRAILDDQFDGLIIGSTELCGVEVNRDLRYVNMLEAIEKTLGDVGLKLKIAFDIQNKCAVCSAVPIANYSNDTELNNDYGYNLVAKAIKNGYNHVICLGQGELTERTVINLYRLNNGTVTQDESLAIADGNVGINRRTMLYDYSSVESEEELLQGGIDQLNENQDTNTLEISNVENVDIGDIVGAKDRITGIYMQKQIISKVLTGYVDNIDIEYKVGDK